MDKVQDADADIEIINPTTRRLRQKTPSKNTKYEDDTGADKTQHNNNGGTTEDAPLVGYPLAAGAVGCCSVTQVSPRAATALGRNTSAVIPLVGLQLTARIEGDGCVQSTDAFALIPQPSSKKQRSVQSSEVGDNFNIDDAPKPGTLDYYKAKLYSSTSTWHHPQETSVSVAVGVAVPQNLPNKNNLAVGDAAPQSLPNVPSPPCCCCCSPCCCDSKADADGIEVDEGNEGKKSDQAPAEKGRLRVWV